MSYAAGRIGFLGDLPPLPYPDAAVSASVASTIWPRVANPAQYGAIYLKAQTPDVYLFRLLVKNGFLPNTAQGYESMMAYVGQGLQTSTGLTPLGQQVQAGTEPFASFWRLVQQYSAATGAINNAYQAKYGADRYAATKFMQAGNYFPLDEFANLIAGGAVPGSVVTPASPVPNPSYPLGIQPLFNPVSARLSFPPPCAFVLGYRRVTVMTGQVPGGGNVVYGPWQLFVKGYNVRLPLGAGAQTNAAAGAWGWRPNSLENVPGAASVPGLRDDDVATYLRDEHDLAATFRGMLPAWPIPVEWGQSFAPQPAPSPVVPYIPGSTVVQAPPGSGGPTMIQLPGSQTWTDVTTLTPQQITAAQQPPAGGGSAPPPVVVTGGPNFQVTGSGSGTQGGGGGGGIVPGASTPGIDLSGMLAGVSPVVLAGAAAGLFLLLGSKRKRRR